MQTTLGPALMMGKGYGAPDVVRTYARARELCRRVGEDTELFAVLHGLWLYYWLRGDIRTVLELAPQLHDMLWFNRNGHLDKGDKIVEGGVR